MEFPPLQNLFKPNGQQQYLPLSKLRIVAQYNREGYYFQNCSSFDITALNAIKLLHTHSSIGIPITNLLHIYL